MNIRKAFYFLLFSLLFSTSVVYALTDTQIEEQIHQILSQRHPSDTREMWKSFGSSTPKVIRLMLEKTSSTYQRIRLTEALAWFPEDAASVTYLKDEADRTDNSTVRTAALRSLGLSQGSKEIDTLAKYLNHEDPQTRFQAAASLKKINDPRAGALLEKYQKEEKATWILAKLKGDLPKASELKPMHPVTSTNSKSVTHEETLSPKWAGVWRGFFLVPHLADEGMRAANIEMKVVLKESHKTSETQISIREAGKELKTSLTGEIQSGLDKKLIVKFSAKEFLKKLLPKEIQKIDALKPDQANLQLELIETGSSNQQLQLMVVKWPEKGVFGEVRKQNHTATE